MSGLFCLPYKLAFVNVCFQHEYNVQVADIMDKQLNPFRVHNPERVMINRWMIYNKWQLRHNGI
ncbi:MAG: hypothetical protein B6D64_05140 [Bacteroidetes bacterium 4484_276]|nr:MAG: hypothetical protein B6D64_05140 [Bacteroidetes bacterium 4484_276]